MDVPISSAEKAKEIPCTFSLAFLLKPFCRAPSPILPILVIFCLADSKCGEWPLSPVDDCKTAKQKMKMQA